MRSAAAVALLACLASGCSDLTIDEAKVNSEERWNNARAGMLCSVGEDRLKFGQLDQAEEKALEAVTLAPKYKRARLLTGRVYVEKGAYPRAEKHLRKAVELDVEDPTALYLLGVAVEKQGRLAAALDCYRDSLELEPTPHAALAASEVLVAMGDIEHAQQFLEARLDLAGEDAGMYELAGRLAAMRDQHGRAADFFGCALDLDNGNMHYREALGRSQVLAGRFAEGAETLKPLLEQEDYEPPTWVYTMLGDCYMAMDRPYAARRAYVTASDMVPETAGVWVNLGRVELALSDNAGAAGAARQALRIEPKNREASMVLGYALLRAGKGRQAAAFLHQANQANPGDATLRCLLGRAYEEALDRPDLARQCYRQALQIDPRNVVARELLRRVEQKVSSADRAGARS